MNFKLSSALASAVLVVATAGPVYAAAVQLSPGPAVLGAAGAILNGSTTTVSGHAGTTALFIGASATDQDLLRAPGLAPDPIFDNKANFPGDVAFLSGAGIVPFQSDDATPPNTNTFVSGVAYANISPPFTPVYHFADFTNINSLADYSASPLSINGIPITAGGAADTYITTHGGYSAFLFVGVEDRRVAGLDDWNDLVYAFKDVTITAPEPASLAILGVALAGLGVIRRRRRS